jgi:hypothetical protein
VRLDRRLGEVLLGRDLRVRGPRVSTAVAVRAKRSGAVPTWVAWALALVQVFALPLSVVGGGLVAGAIWLAVGYLMLIGGLGRAAVSPAAA